MNLFFRKPERPKLKKNQEWVWDYPRPPRLEPFTGHIRILFNGEVIADADSAWRVLETSHPPVYYIPQSSIAMKFLKPGADKSYCEWKGLAHYYDIRVGDRSVSKVAWKYPDPVYPFVGIKDHLAFYAHLMDSCKINNDPVVPQPGNFYGGWITPNIIGPFKGGPGSMGW